MTLVWGSKHWISKLFWLVKLSNWYIYVCVCTPSHTGIFKIFLKIRNTVPTGQLASSLSPLTNIPEPVNQCNEASPQMWLCWATLQQLLQRKVHFLLCASASSQGWRWSILYCCKLKHSTIVRCMTVSQPKPIHERDSFDPGLTRLVAQRTCSPFCCVATPSTQAYRDLTFSFFVAPLVMVEKLKASSLSALYTKWTNSAVTLSNDMDAYKFALYY